MLVDLNKNEKIVMDAIRRNSSEDCHQYVDAGSVNKELKHLSNHQFAGYISSLVKKGWIYSFTPYPDGDIDLEITCEACLFYGSNAQSCNGHNCKYCLL